ncbi:hypothetical protein [Bradyrhizobium sp. AUGA SZCCT0431]|uniref:hypothetical protein n=1 Tax=Bradyrhizobium sp. AUGA SZCCT0431 TaxID=2807674 RepID=UPI001BA8CA0F|nr:hypothetical protein [Bradyrhizobium sp. AUGA SZCCT0431]MBR1146319.1 hypothetical protein [Bradyrhizobium sp. AUGA SZCCT0431]
MNDQFENITNAAHVDIYAAGNEIFEALLEEVRELSKKKPDATMSSGKVKIVNRVLKDLLTFLKDEPEGKYLEELDDDELPQVSDALLVMVQFNTALKKFFERHHRYVSALGYSTWITTELVAELEETADDSEDDESE